VVFNIPKIDDFQVLCLVLTVAMILNLLESGIYLFMPNDNDLLGADRYTVPAIRVFLVLFSFIVFFGHLNI
jgi:hypothetical protein